MTPATTAVRTIAKMVGTSRSLPYGALVSRFDCGRPATGRAMREEESYNLSCRRVGGAKRSIASQPEGFVQVPARRALASLGVCDGVRRSAH